MSSPFITIDGGGDDISCPGKQDTEALTAASVSDSSSSTVPIPVASGGTATGMSVF